MRNFKWWVYYGVISKKLIWIRCSLLSGKGIEIIKTKPLFSQRYGYKKYLHLFGWRIGLLRCDP